MWIRTFRGNLVNLSQCTAVGVQHADSQSHPFAINATEPFYVDGPCQSFTLGVYKTKAEAEEALNDLYDWIGAQVGGVGCDFSAK